MKILRTKLYDMKQKEQSDKIAGERKLQVGSGDRSERIRTYNYPQNRVTDHRYNVSTFDLPKVMEGDLGLIIEPIIQINCERQLEELRG